MKMFSVSEAADELGVSDALVYALCRRRKIRHERHGLGKGVIRISQAALDEYRRSCEVRPEEEQPEPLPRKKTGRRDDFTEYYQQVMEEVARKHPR